MIAYISGKIINKGQNCVILSVNGLGYRVYVNSRIYPDLEIGSRLDVYTYQHIREDASDLYGFNTLEELELFELLLSISGVGPKSGLAVFSIASAEDVKEAIVRGDSSLLTKVSGIGRKTAERIVLELREKIVKSAAENVYAENKTGISASSDEIDALVALGYSLPQAREALRKADPGAKDSSDRIKQALKNLGK